MIDTLSSELRVHLRAPTARRVAARATRPAPEPTEGYPITTGIRPVDRPADLAAIDHVVEIEGPQRYTPEIEEMGGV